MGKSQEIHVSMCVSSQGLAHPALVSMLSAGVTKRLVLDSLPLFFVVVALLYK